MKRLRRYYVNIIVDSECQWTSSFQYSELDGVITIG